MSALIPYLGLEWRPLSRADLTWVEDGNTTGLAVGGLDGFTRPQLLPYGGAWVGSRVAVHGALGVARLQTTTWEGEVFTQRHWGVIRPEIDVRVALLERGDPRPIPWVLFGAHVDVPSARDVSNGYTPDEQAAADQLAAADRARLGAIGGRAGIGADLGLGPWLRVGAQWALDWQRSLFLGNDPSAVTSFVAAEGALLVELCWPRRGAGEDREGDGPEGG